MPSTHYCTLPTSSAAADRWVTCSAAARCEAGYRCHGGVRHPCGAGRYNGDRGLATSSECPDQCSAGYFCPEASVLDRVEACAPSTATDPASYYCPAGSTRRYRTSDFVADVAGQRGTYTLETAPSDLRTTAQPCPAGHACWGGVKYPLVTFADGQCSGGSMVMPLALTAGTKAWKKNARVATGMRFKAANRLHRAVGEVSLGAAMSIGDFKALPGCSMGNPFTMAADGTLAGSASDVSLLDCPAMRFTVQASVAGATAQCTVTVRAASSSAKSAAVGVATGGEHMCYLARAGTDWGGAIRCIGKSGDMSVRVSSLPMVGGHGFMQVAVGTSHSCGLDAAGAIRCIGTAHGRGAGLEHLWGEANHLNMKYTAVAAGDDFTCAIARGYKGQEDSLQRYRYLECRGSNVRLAQAYAALQGTWESTPIAAVAVGSSVACSIVDADRSLRCFGAGAASFLQIVPSGAFDVVAVSDGANACAIRAVSKSMVCWGTLWNSAAQEYAGPYESVALGSDWMCAIQSSDKSLACFGMHVPRVFTSYSAVPKGAMAQVSAWGSTLCVLQEDGRAECFGELARASPSTLGALPSGDAAELSTV